MIGKQLYFKIAEEYGEVASWAIWEKAGGKPKSNISSMEIFDINAHPSTLHILRTDIVMVALNFSRAVEIKEPFKNFHDENPYAQDYKIRFAFENTDYYGAYMTDIIKDFPMLSSKDVLNHLKDNPDEIKKQIVDFKEELDFIGAHKPKILVFGNDAYNILNKNLSQNDYSELVALTHYSHHISKEKYRIDTHERLGISNNKN